MCPQEPADNSVTEENSPNKQVETSAKEQLDSNDDDSDSREEEEEEGAEEESLDSQKQEDEDDGGVEEVSLAHELGAVELPDCPDGVSVSPDLKDNAGKDTMTDCQLTLNLAPEKYITSADGT
jgi:hypothetical protein